jgi:hypothetical protein
MELLADITFRLTAHEVARLWFCGSKLLNLKLHDGGAPIFDFRLEHVSDFKWPTLVASLAHLRQFSISIALGNCASLSDSLDFWELVPKSVQKLDLTAGLGLSQLARFLQLHGDKGLPNLVSFSFMNPGKDMIELFPTLGTFFPNLQTLDIQALPNQAVASHRLVIAYLPRTLTALKISSSFLCFSADDAPTRLAEWPSGMAALAISNTPFSFTPDLLPRALQSLILQHIHTASASSFDWASLPCGLETLSLHSLDFLKAVDLLRMPSLLRHSLRMLECTTRSISPLTGSEQWVSETLALIEALPPNLTSLYYHFGATLTQEHIVRLPKGLKSMIASSIPTKPSLVPFVPAQFETLCIHVGEEEWPKSQKISESVKHITIKSLLDGAVPVDLREELTLEMVLKNLPSHLERFEFTGHTMTPREILLLPRGLREFITSAKLAGEACLVNMPPHLTGCVITGTLNVILRFLHLPPTSAVPLRIYRWKRYQLTIQTGFLLFQTLWEDYTSDTRGDSPLAMRLVSLAYSLISTLIGQRWNPQAWSA